MVPFTLTIEGLVTFVIAAVIILGLLLLLREIKSLKANPIPGVPGEDAILDALLPWVYTGILAAEKAAFDTLDAGLAALDGEMKADIAGKIYDMLPPVLIIAGVPIPIAVVKRLIPRDAFEGFIAQEYDQVHAFIVTKEAYFKSQIDAQIPANSLDRAALAKQGADFLNEGSKEAVTPMKAGTLVMSVPAKPLPVTMTAPMTPPLTDESDENLAPPTHYGEPDSPDVDGGGNVNPMMTLKL